MAGSTADVSVELMVEVLLHAPTELTPAEKLLLTVIAESCNSKTRMTWFRAGWDATEVARRAHLTEGSLSKTFWSMAQKGCEVRVSHGTDKNGNPVFAHKGKQTTFRLPRFAPQSVDKSPGIDSQRSDEDRTFDARSDAKAPTYVGVRSDEDRTIEAQRSDDGRTLLLKDLPSKNTSSLSVRETTTRPAAIVPSLRDERDDEDASQNLKSKKPTDRTTVLLGAGLTNNEADSFTDWADNNLPGGRKGDGWYLTLHRNGTLTDRISEWRSSGPADPACDTCHGEGETGDYLNRRPCGCLWFTDPDRIRPDWVRQLASFEPCDHGINGGDQEAPNGWRYCALCRGPGWVDRNLQPRTEERVIRSPADQRVAEGAVLYAKYKAQEHGQHKTFKNPSIENYYGEL
jgi:hypothetical protein